MTLAQDPYAKYYGGTVKTRSDLTQNSGVVGTAKYVAPKQEAVPLDVGNMSVNPADPIGSIGGIADSGSNVVEGLKNFLIGTSQPDRQGNHGGLLGGIPIVSDLARAGTEVVANAASGLATVPGHAADFIGGALEHVPIPSAENIRQEFDAMSDDDPLKQDAVLAMKGDGSLIGPANDHIMAMAVQQSRDKLKANDPQLFDNLFVPTVTLADAVTNLFGLLGAGERVVERGYAGFDAIQGGGDQLDMILSVGKGEAGFKPSWSFGGKDGGFDTTLSPVEQTAFDMVTAGTWTHEQGLTYLASHGRGISHDTLSQIAGSVAFDPIGDAAIVMSAGAALGLKGLSLTAGVRAAESTLQGVRGLRGLDAAAQMQKLRELGLAGNAMGNRVFDTVKTVLGDVNTQVRSAASRTAREFQYVEKVSPEDAAWYASRGEAVPEAAARTALGEGEAHAFKSWEPASQWADESGFAIKKGDLTPEQNSAINEYSGGYSSNINEGARTGTANAALDGVMKPVPEPVIAYRGTDTLPGGIAPADVQVGDVLSDGGYLSTTLASENSALTGRAARMEISVEPGAKGIWVDPHSSIQGEAELLLARETKFYVTAIEDTADGRVIRVSTSPGTAPSVPAAPRTLTPQEIDVIEESAKQYLTDAQKSYAVTMAKNPDTSARLNLIGKLMETPEGTKIVKVLSAPYAEAMGTVTGRAFKVARTIIDPLHEFTLPGLGIKARLNNESIDLTTELVTRTAIEGTYGKMAMLKVVDLTDRLDPTGKLTALISDHFGTHIGNVTNEVMATSYRNNIMAKFAAALTGTGEDYISPLGESIKLSAYQRKSLLMTVKETTNKFLQRVWTPEDLDNLAVRLEKMYGSESGLTKADWAPLLQKMSVEERSILHTATYGRANDRLFEVLAEARKAIADDPALAKGLMAPEKLDRLILLRKTRLTDVGAQGIMDRITAATGDIPAQMREMREAQSLYPELNYVSIDATNLRGTIEQFLTFMKKTNHRLPHQAMDEELADAPLLRALQDEMYGAFTLGFRPDQEFMWGIELTGDGYKAVGSVFVDHVAPTGQMYRVAKGVGRGPKGAPIFLRRPVSWLSATSSMMMNSISGAMISEAARQRFIGNLALKWAPQSVDKRVAGEMWEGIMGLLDSQSITVNPRGFDARSLFKAIEDLVPPEARHSGFDANEVMSHILDAYKGDLRFVGASQWLTGRAKAVAFQMTGSNALGQLSEMAWPLLKFRLNIVFQGQERVEGFVLNAQRGVDAALGTKLTAVDQMTDEVLKHTVEQSFERMADVDISEQQARVLFGNSILEKANVPGARLQKLRQMQSSLMNVQGNKRLNMLRTFRDGLGAEVRSTWDQVYPGQFDAMKNAEQIRINRIISDDDYAISLMAENLLGNDIAVRRMLDAGGKFTGFKADFKAAITTAEWMKPSHFGELRTLALDDMADLTGVGGAKDLKSLRAAIASGKASMDDLTRVLRMNNADPDYIRRVENAINFNWDDFMSRIDEAFHMTPEQSTQFQRMIAGIADSRQMTPVEYLSQVFAPNIIGGMDAAVGALGDAVNVVVNGQTEIMSNLAKFAAGDQSGFDDLIRQFTKVFSQHLDPSLKKALLMEFQPDLMAKVADGTIRLDMNEIENLFKTLGPDTLADRILGFYNGVPGTAAFDPITDAAIGSPMARSRAVQYMLQRGRPEAPAGRRLMQINEDTLTEIAKAHDATSALPMPTDATPVTSKSLGESLLKKPQIRDSAAPTHVAEAYQEWVSETRAQYLHMALGAGGKKIKVALVSKRPYQGPLVNGMGKQQFEDEFYALVDKSVSGTLTKAEQKRWDAIVNKLTRDEYLDLGDPGTWIPNVDDVWKVLSSKVKPKDSLQKDLDSGIVKVFNGDTAHPILTPEQVIEFRAVHTFYGKGGEGFADDLRGRVNAISTHAQMYDAEARSAMLSDQLGQEASRFATPNPVEEPFAFTNVDDAERLLFGEGPVQTFGYADIATPGAVHAQQRHIGERLRAADTRTQEGIITMMASLMKRFPHVGIDGFDVNDMTILGQPADTMAITVMQSPKNKITIIFSDKLFTTQAAETLERARVTNELSRISASMRQIEPMREDSAMYAALTGKPYIINFDYFGLAEDDYVGLAKKITPDFLTDLQTDHSPDVRAVLDDVTSILSDFKASQRIPRMTDSTAMGRILQVKLVSDGTLDSPKWLEKLFDTASYEPEKDYFMSGIDMADPKAVARANSEYEDAVNKWQIAGLEYDGLVAQSERMHEYVDSFVQMRPTMDVPRTTKMGVPHNVDITLEGTASHEFAHALYDSIVHRGDYGPHFQKIVEDLEVEFHKSGVAKMMSEYAATAGGEKDSVISESFAELIALSFSRTEDAARTLSMAPAPVRTWVHRVRTQFAKEGLYTPNLTNHGVPKGNLMDPAVMRKFSDEHIGIGRYSEASPDVGRTARYFSNFMESAVRPVLEGGNPSNPDIAAIFKQFKLAPPGPATPYNFSEGLLMDLATNSMKAKWKDAYRLQYFQQDRSMLQRSINHPMFGIYPASYMWGKILPEMASFVLQKPFGSRTGAMLDNLLMAQRAIALRREFDPEFKKQIEDVGHNAALSFLGYMLPAVPWDVNAGVPVWMRDFAKQGLQNGRNVATGKPVKGADLAVPAADVMKKLIPYTTTIPWAARAGDAMPWSEKNRTPSGPVQGADIGATLDNALQELRDALSR